MILRNVSLALFVLPLVWVKAWVPLYFLDSFWEVNTSTLFPYSTETPKLKLQHNLIFLHTQKKTVSAPQPFFLISEWWVTSWLFGLVMVTVGPMVGTGHAWVTFQPPSLPLFTATWCCIGHQWFTRHPTTHTYTFRPLHSYCNNPQAPWLSTPSLVKLDELYLRPFLFPHKDSWSL